MTPMTSCSTMSDGAAAFPAPAATALPAEQPEFAPRRILVATDGRAASDGALRLARALATRDGVSVARVAVCEPRIAVPPALPAGHEHAGDARVDEAAVASLAARLYAQSERLFGAAADWPIHLAAGYPAARIDRVARREGADLILAGLGSPAREERLFSKETALAVAFSSDVPVLAAAADACRLPRRALVVLEHDDASLRAARLAMRLLDDGGTIHLVHVRDGAPAWSRDSGWGVQRLFELASHGAAERGISVHHLVVDGAPVPPILAAADRRGVELIATGLHGCTVPERSTMPNVAAPLLREARCSVVVSC